MCFANINQLDVLFLMVKWPEVGKAIQAMCCYLCGMAARLNKHGAKKRGFCFRALFCCTLHFCNIFLAVSNFESQCGKLNDFQTFFPKFCRSIQSPCQLWKWSGSVMLSTSHTTFGFQSSKGSRLTCAVISQLKFFHNQICSKLAVIQEIYCFSNEQKLNSTRFFLQKNSTTKHSPAFSCLPCFFFSVSRSNAVTNVLGKSPKQKLTNLYKRHHTVMVTQTLN